MTETTRKEDLSISYISAVCAHAGIDYETIRHDADSTDAIIKKIVNIGNGREYVPELRIQLKSTSSPSQYTDNGKYLTYRLKAKNYNDLCMEGTSQSILALLVLPENESEWLKWTSEELLIRGCMYWASFTSKKPSENKGTINVHIKKKNMINSTTLNKIMDKIAREEWPCNIQ